MSKKILLVLLVILCGVLLTPLFQSVNKKTEEIGSTTDSKRFELFNGTSPTLLPTPPLPPQHVLTNEYHVFQTFNNCGPAALSMGLSYFDIKVSQEDLGNELRPYKATPGNNDDKSVTLEELGKKAEEYGLLYFHRPNGTVEMLEKIIAAGVPVITRTWLHPDEDIGHYRVVKGYDRNQRVIIQDDSYEGANLSYDYESFNGMWEKFNYEYLVIFPVEMESQVEEIIGEDLSAEVAWQNARLHAENLLIKNPDDIYARFNLSVALYHLGKFEESISEFESVESKLPFRTLWYQIEPIDAYYQVQDFEQVFTITQNLFENGNRAYAEAYVIRGKSYEAMGDTENARAEYEKALLYNKNLEGIHQLMQAL
ncbi:C39 family peptidase [Candidatus Woesebacteria bacterium]|nr:C39 family peptidase [Candidatus Woesebacteria bacterium]